MPKSPLVHVDVCTRDADLEFSVPENTRGFQLLETVCTALGIRECHYFGLVKRTFNKNDMYSDGMWQRLDKKIDSTKFDFIVKFYPEDITSELIQDSAIHFFYLEVKAKLLLSEINCPVELAVMLASYHIQAEYGDDLSSVSVGDVLPASILKQYQLGHEQWLERIQPWHQQNAGMDSGEAEFAYIQLAQNLDMFGVSYFAIRNVKNTALWLGVTPYGLNSYSFENKIKPQVTFSWSEIAKLRCKGRKLTIITMDKEKEPHTDFTAVDKQTARLIHQLCVGNHQLFLRRRRADSLEHQQMRYWAHIWRTRRQQQRQRLLLERRYRVEAERTALNLRSVVDELRTQLDERLDEAVKAESSVALLMERVRLAREESNLQAEKANLLQQELVQIKVGQQSQVDHLLHQPTSAALLHQQSPAAMLYQSSPHFAPSLISGYHGPLVDSRVAFPPVTVARQNGMDGEIGLNTPLSRFSDTVWHSPLQSQAPTTTIQQDQMHLYSNLPIVPPSGLPYQPWNKAVQEQLKLLQAKMEPVRNRDLMSSEDRALESVEGETKFDTLNKTKSGSTSTRVNNFENM